MTSQKLNFRNYVIFYVIFSVIPLLCDLLRYTLKEHDEKCLFDKKQHLIAIPNASNRVMVFVYRMFYMYILKCGLHLSHMQG